MHAAGPALRLALRCARDSVPPLRLAVVEDVAAHPASTTTAVRTRLGVPHATADRQLQSLQLLGVLVCDERPTLTADAKRRTLWHYSLVDGFDAGALALPDLSS